jgi:serine phosphatase RsbU (regulator of sigma subunit)
MSDTRMVFMLTDVAGKRDEALHIAAAVQDRMHELAPELLSDPDANVAEGVTDLVLELNRTIMQTAGGVRSAPTFLGCLDEQFGLIHYVSAGHTPAFVKSDGEITQLDPNGLPLGLFSHSTHDAQVSVAQPGSSIVLVSKGLVESSAGRQEFGVERVRGALEEKSFPSAYDLCHEILERAVRFAEQPSSFGPRLAVPGFRSSQEPNDLTVVCLMRMAQSAAAV